MSYAFAGEADGVNFKAQDCTYTLEGRNYAKEHFGDSIKIGLVGKNTLHLKTSHQEQALRIKQGEHKPLSSQEGIFNYQWQKQGDSYNLSIIETLLNDFDKIQNTQHSVSIYPQGKSLKIVWTKKEENGWGSTTQCNYIAFN